MSVPDDAYLSVCLVVAWSLSTGNCSHVIQALKGEEHLGTVYHAVFEKDKLNTAF